METSNAETPHGERLIVPSMLVGLTPGQSVHECVQVCAGVHVRV